MIFKLTSRDRRMSMTKDVFINGNWESGDGEGFSSICPATQQSVWQGKAANESQVNRAVAAAKQAFKDWSHTSFETRRDILLKYRDNITASNEALATAISRDMGKPLWEAKTEANAMASKVAISLQAYEERTGRQSNESSSLSHRPHGVMAVFGPFNFPGHLPNGHIIPSLIAGNTVVFKPSELTPAIAEIMSDCFEKAGFPKGVLNIVQGGRETGGALLKADVDGVLFTGSAETGLTFHKFFAGRPEVMLALEMGGNNPLIITEATDIQAAADIAFISGYITSGQRCTCARRLILPKGSHGDAILDAISARIDDVKIGAWREDVFMGPVVSTQSADNAMGFQSKLIAAGAASIKAITRGDAKGAFLRPGLIDTTHIQSPDKELFGPLMQVIRVADLKEAISRANATRFGLAAGLISDDAEDWAHAKAELKAGIVNWNKPTTGAASSLPFGGPGLSGNHRPSAYYAADYCAWPQASQISEKATAPKLMHF